MDDDDSKLGARLFVNAKLGYEALCLATLWVNVANLYLIDNRTEITVSISTHNKSVEAPIKAGGKPPLNCCFGFAYLHKHQTDLEENSQSAETGIFKLLTHGDPT